MEIMKFVKTKRVWEISQCATNNACIRHCLMNCLLLFVKFVWNIPWCPKRVSACTSLSEKFSATLHRRFKMKTLNSTSRHFNEKRVLHVNLIERLTLLSTHFSTNPKPANFQVFFLVIMILPGQTLPCIRCSLSCR